MVIHFKERSNEITKPPAGAYSAKERNMKAVNDYLAEGKSVTNVFYAIDSLNCRIILSKWKRKSLASMDTVEAIMAIEDIFRKVAGTFINSLEVDGEIVSEQIFYPDGSSMKVERVIKKEEYRN